MATTTAPEIGAYIEAHTAEGFLARGEVVSRDRGANGAILYVEVRNPVSGQYIQVFPETWVIDSVRPA